MATFETVEPGTIALIQQTPEGRILQIGLTPFVWFGFFKNLRAKNGIRQ